MASYHSPGDKPPQRERVVRKNTETKQKWQLELNHLHMYQGSQFLSSFRTLLRSLHLHPSDARGHLQHQPYLGPPRTYFRHHTILAMWYLSVLSTSKPSQYSLINSTCQLPFYSSSSTHSFIPNSIHFISRTFTFLLSALFIMPHASAPYNYVGRITPSCRHFPFIPNLLLLGTLFRPPHALYPSFIVLHTSHIVHLLSLATPGTEINPLPLPVCHLV